MSRIAISHTASERGDDGDDRARGGVERTELQTLERAPRVCAEVAPGRAADERESEERDERDEHAGELRIA